MTKKNQKARNERERKRVHQVNHGFDILRDRLQPKNHTKKWSKADTLREAVKYIQQLQHLLNTEAQAQNQPGPSSSEYSQNPNDFNQFPMKEEFSVYLPPSYQMPPPHQQPPQPFGTTTSSPTSSVSSSYSPSQMCFQTQTPAYYHHQ